MKKCKKKDGLVYDFEVAEIKKVEYRIYSNNDFICAMSENEFKENFEVIEEGKSYSSILKEFVNSDYDGERSILGSSWCKKRIDRSITFIRKIQINSLYGGIL